MLPFPHVEKPEQPPEVFLKKLFLKISQNSQEKNISRSLLFEIATGHRPANLLKQRLRHRCFPEDFDKF